MISLNLTEITTNSNHHLQTKKGRKAYPGLLPSSFCPTTPLTAMPKTLSRVDTIVRATPNERLVDTIATFKAEEMATWETEM